MTDLFADPDYIKGLAPYQDQAAAAFDSASGAVSGLAEKVSSTHGVICGGSKRALQEVEDAHNALALAMQKYSSDLAAWLRTAACAYENTDELAAHEVNRQVG